VPPAIKVETLRHREAFNYYYLLGEKRSRAKVARRFGVSEMAVRKWIASFDWHRRIRERDESVAQGMDKEVIASFAEAKTRWLRDIVAIVDRELQAYRDTAEHRRKNNSMIPGLNPSELITLAQLGLKLAGDPDVLHRVEGKVEHIVSDELATLREEDLRRIVRECAGVVGPHGPH